MKSSGGFTWFKVLIIIVVLVILAVLLFPAVDGGRPSPDSRKRAQAKNDVVQIATSITYFRNEYGHLPSTNSEVQNVDGPLLQALIGSNTVLNPGRFVILEVQTAKRGKSGILNGVFVDPWGSPYKIMFDTDGDNVLTNVGPTQQATAVLKKIVAVWNDPSTHADGATPTKKQRRFVTSWE